MMQNTARCLAVIMLATPRITVVTNTPQDLFCQRADGCPGWDVFFFGTFPMIQVGPL